MVPLPKISLVSITPYPGIYLPELRYIAAELRGAGYPVMLIVAKASADDPDYEEQDGLVIYRLPAFSRLQVELFFLRVVFILRRERPSIAHVFWRFGAFIVPLLLITSGVRVALDIRTASISSSPLRRLLENTFLFFDNFFYKKTIIVDPYLDKRLRLNSDLFITHGVPASMLVERTPEYDVRAQLIRKRLGIDINDRVGIYVGTSYLRNLEIVVEALRVLRAEGERCMLVVIGDFIRTTKLDVRSLREEGVIVLSEVSNDLLISYIHAADFGVIFIPINPGFDYQRSTKVPLFFSGDLPILATATSANKVVIEDGVSGVIVPDTTVGVVEGIREMLRFLDDPVRMEGVRNIGLHYRQTLSWERIVRDKLIPFYQAYINEK